MRKHTQTRDKEGESFAKSVYTIKHLFSQYAPEGDGGEGGERIRPTSTTTTALTTKMLACTFRFAANRLLSSSRFIVESMKRKEKKNCCCHSALSRCDVMAFESNISWVMVRWCVCALQSTVHT